MPHLAADVAGIGLVADPLDDSACEFEHEVAVEQDECLWCDGGL